VKPRSTVLIVGTSSGIGAQLAKSYAKQGHHLIRLSRRVTGDMIHCDVCDSASVKKAFASIDLESVDLFIYNAGISKSDDDEAVIQTNLLGAVRCIEQILPIFKAKKSGHIVGMSSLAGQVAVPGAGAYSASKAGLDRYLDALRRELKPLGIAVTTIRPGFIKTPLTAKNQFKMPFLMETKTAVTKMIKGIENKKSVIYMPWIFSVAIRVLGHFHEVFQDFLVGNKVCEKGD